MKYGECVRGRRKTPIKIRLWLKTYFFINHYEPADKFQIGEAAVTGSTAVVTANFDYAENGKVYETRQTKSVFVKKAGRWLLDNVVFDEGADLKTLLSRKKYDVLPN